MSMNNQQGPPNSFLCPSFNSYSTGNLALIADQVAAGDYAGDDFEFVTFQKAADEVFFDGRVGPVFPVFDRDLLKTDHNTETQPRGSNAGEEDAVALQLSMAELLIRDGGEDRDPPSSSSSEAGDLESIPAGTYCVWTPKSAEAEASASASPSRCEKSNSTGTSSSSAKKWKLLDLLRRSNSEGKESFVFLTPSASVKKRDVKSEKPAGKVAGKKVSAHEEFYVRNREMKKGERRKSYLPYRQDLVGFFANVHGMGKPFPPF